ncbi:unnamed protein product [Symbiodinium microadriaticum]|nr:unnamed protein product [Symbiodinium microadriaticum]
MFLSALALLICLSSLVSEGQAGENYAFLVAVGDYDVKHLKALAYTRNDILEFRTELLKSGFPKQNIVLLHDDLKQLENRRYLPEADKIRQEFTLLLSGVEPDDTIIVALAGHGVQFKGDQTSYFCPADADLDDEKHARLISFQELYQGLEKCQARKKLLLIDACRNDPQSQLSRSRAKVNLQSITRPQTEPVPEGIVALFSCSAGEQAYEWPDLKHGIFFHHVLEGWKGAADDGDRSLSLDELVAYTRKKTQTFARLKLATIQRPQRLGNFSGTWILSELSRDLITNSIGMNLKLIPTGTFMMGNAKSSAELKQIFGSFPEGINVTQKQWETVMGTTPWSEKEKAKVGPDYAASYISWEDATEYCRKLSAKEKRQYRLPTEAEWEYACRAGSTTIFSFGDDKELLDDYAWYAQKLLFNNTTADLFGAHAHKVAQKKPNAFGLYDMSGNLWEWCQDYYQADYYKTSPAFDPAGPEMVEERSKWMRSMRGGGIVDAIHLRSARRRFNADKYRAYFNGFRVVCEQE